MKPTIWTAAASAEPAVFAGLKMTPLSDLTPEQRAEWRAKALERLEKSRAKTKEMMKAFRKVPNTRRCRHCGRNP